MEENKQVQEGTGSAENINKDRQEQQAKTSYSDAERSDIGEQIGENKDRISDIQETGNVSGRDDMSGGTGDNMESQDTGAATDR